jgi:hypothetical protein
MLNYTFSDKAEQNRIIEWPAAILETALFVSEKTETHFAHLESRMLR